MSRVLTSILRRLSSPHVAFRLDKSELSLSLAAAASMGCDPLRYEQSLVGRTVQLASTMSNQDLGVISRAALEFKWLDPLLLDCIAERLFHTAVHPVVMNVHQFLPILNLFCTAYESNYINLTLLEWLGRVSVDTKGICSAEAQTALRSLAKFTHWFELRGTSEIRCVSELISAFQGFPQPNSSPQLNALRATFPDSESSAGSDVIAGEQFTFLAENVRRQVLSVLLRRTANLELLMSACEMAMKHALHKDIVLISELDVQVATFVRDTPKLSDATVTRLNSLGHDFLRVHSALSKLYSAGSNSAIAICSDAQNMLCRRNLGLDCTLGSVQNILKRLEDIPPRDFVAVACAILPQCTAADVETLSAAWCSKISSLRERSTFELLNSIVAELLRSTTTISDRSKTSNLLCWSASILDGMEESQVPQNQLSYVLYVATRLWNAAELLSERRVADTALRTVKKCIDQPRASRSVKDLCYELECVDMLEAQGAAHVPIQGMADELVFALVSMIEHATDLLQTMPIFAMLKTVKTVRDELVDALHTRLRKSKNEEKLPMASLLEIAKEVVAVDILDIDPFLADVAAVVKGSDVTLMTAASRLAAIEIFLHCRDFCEASRILSTLSSCTFTVDDLRDLRRLAREHTQVIKSFAHICDLLTHVVVSAANVENSNDREFALVCAISCCRTLKIDLSRCVELSCAAELDQIVALADPEMFGDVVLAVCSSSWDDSAKATFIDAVLSCLHEKSSRLTPAAFASIARTLGDNGQVGLKLSHHLAVDRISDFAVDNEHHWSCRSVADVLYGFAGMQCTKRSLFNVFSSRLAKRPVLSGLAISDVSGAVASFGSSKYVDLPLLNRLGRKIGSATHQVLPKDILNTVCGYSRMMLHDDGLYEKMGNRAIQLMPQFPVEDAVKLIAAFSHVSVFHDNLLSAVLVHANENISHLSSNSAATLLVTAWQMDYSGDVSNLEKLADHIASNPEMLSADSVLNLCTVLQNLSWRHGKLLSGLATQAARLATSHSLPPETCRVVLDTLFMFLIQHTQAREALSPNARTVSRDVITASEEEMDEIKRKALGGR